MMAKETSSSSIGLHGTHAQMSPEEFALWGSNDVAFIKPSVFEGEPVCILTDATGSPLGIGSTPETASAEAEALGFIPLKLH